MSNQNCRNSFIALQQQFVTWLESKCAEFVCNSFITFHEISTIHDCLTHEQSPYTVHQSGHSSADALNDLVVALRSTKQTSCNPAGRLLVQMRDKKNKRFKLNWSPHSLVNF